MTEVALLELQRIDAVRQSGLADGRRRPALDIMARTAAQALRTSMGFVTVIDHDRQYAPGCYGLALGPIAREHSFCDHTAMGLEPLAVHDMRRDARFRDNPFVAGEPFVRAYAGVPLIDAHGNALGALCVAERFARGFETGELLSLLRLGDMAVRLIENEARRTRYRLAS